MIILVSLNWEEDDIKDIIEGALAGGHLQLAKRYLPEKIVEEFVPSAVISGDISVVSFIVDLLDKFDLDDYIKYLNDGFIKHNYSAIIDFLRSKGADDLAEAVYAAAAIGDKSLMEKFMGQDKLLSYSGLLGACWGGIGTLLIILLIKERLIYAAEAGHIDLVEYFISKGETDYTAALTRSIRGGSITGIEYILPKLSNTEVKVIVNQNIIFADNIQIYRLIEKWIDWTPENLRYLIGVGGGIILRQILKTHNPIISEAMLVVGNKQPNIAYQLALYRNNSHQYHVNLSSYRLE